MKKSLFYILLVLFFTACDEHDEIVMPEADFVMSASEVSVYETVTFNYTGSPATQVVVYTGDPGHNYELKEEGNSGFVVNKGVATYAYKTPGTYEVVMIATNYDRFGNGQSLMSVTRKSITVKDDDNELRSLSLKKDLYNKELPAEIVGNQLRLAVPEKVRVNNRDIAVNLKAQRLEVSTMSANAAILLNGDPIVTTKKYDLTQELTLSVVAASGDVRDYSIHALSLPSFTSFSVGNATGTVTYSNYDFNKCTVTISIPSGTDLTNVIPTFVSTSAKKIYLNGVEQVSGVTAVDFTSPVEYELVNFEEGNESFTCTMYVTVMAN